MSRRSAVKKIRVSGRKVIIEYQTFKDATTAAQGYRQLIRIAEEMGTSFDSLMENLWSNMEAFNYMAQMEKKFLNRMLNEDATGVA